MKSAGGAQEGSRRFLLAALGAATLVALWWIVARLVGSSIIVPTPIETLSSLLSEIRDPDFYHSILATVARALSGFAASLLLGTLWGLVGGRSASVDRFLRPALVLIRATPVIAVILLALIWFRPTIAPVVVTLLMVLPVVAENVMVGVREASRPLLEIPS